MKILLVILFPYFLVRLILSAAPDLIWLLCLSFKQWKIVTSALFLLATLFLFGLQNLSPTPPFQSPLTPNEKLNRALKTQSDQYLSFQPTQPHLPIWIKTQEKYSENRDVLVQAALAAFYAGEYQKAELLWQKARSIDPLYPLFEVAPSLLQFTTT